MSREILKLSVNLFKFQELDNSVKTILTKWGTTDLVKLSDSIQTRDNTIDNLNKQIIKKDEHITLQKDNITNLEKVLKQADYLAQGIIDSKIVFTKTELEVKPEDSEVIKSLKQFLGRKKTDIETSTDDTTGTMMEGYQMMKTKIRINVLDLDFHNVGKLNASVRIETDPFTVFTRKEKDGDGEINKDPMTCEGILCFGGYNDIKVLEQYKGKDITFTFDNWKIIHKDGRNWLYLLYSDNWAFVKVADKITKTELTMADLKSMEQSLELLSNKLTVDKIVDKDTQGGKDILFRLEIVKRGVASLEEDKEHNKTQGQEMKIQIAKLEEDVRLSKITEVELNKKTYELEQLVKRKESEWQKQLEEKLDELKQIEEKFKSLKSEKDLNDTIVSEKEQTITSLRKAIEDRIEEIRIINNDRETIRIESEGFSKDLANIKKELETKNKSLNDMSIRLSTETNKQSHFLNDLNIYRNSLNILSLSPYSNFYSGVYNLREFLKRGEGSSQIVPGEGQSFLLFRPLVYSTKNIDKNTYYQDCLKSSRNETLEIYLNKPIIFFDTNCYQDYFSNDTETNYDKQDWQWRDLKPIYPFKVKFDYKASDTYLFFGERDGGHQIPRENNANSKIERNHGASLWNTSTALGFYFDKVREYYSFGFSCMTERGKIYSSTYSRLPYSAPNYLQIELRKN